MATKEITKEEELGAESGLLNLLDGKTEVEIKKLHGWLCGEFNRAKRERTKYEQEWYLNLAFYMGRQNVVPAVSKAALISSSTGLYEPKPPRWGVRLIANKIQPTIRNELTKLTKEEMQFFVVPATTEDSDRSAARAGESIAEYLFDKIELNRIRSEASLWACISGNGFTKVYFDPMEDDPSAIPEIDPTTGMEMPKTGPSGVVTADCINPFFLFFGDLTKETIEKQPWITQAITMSKAEVEGMFQLDNVEEDSKSDSTPALDKVNSILEVPTDSAKGTVWVREMWIKPSLKWPDGAVIWFTEKQILRAIPWYYQHMQYPFQHLRHIPVPGRFYASSVVTQMITLQREYNKVRSQLIENKNRMSRPQLLAPKGSIEPKQLTSEPGLIILYSPGFAPPTPLQVPEIPQYVLQEQERILKDMDDVSGQYEITKGRTPPGVEAASAIAYLQEENDSRMHHTIASMELMMTKIGRQLLALVGQYWTLPRLVRVVSRNNVEEAKKFMGADLRGNFDLRIEPGSMAPRSRAARQAFITELMKMGAIPPDKGLKYLQMSETNRLYMDLQLDQRHAERENSKMAEMQPPMQNPLEAQNPDMMLQDPNQQQQIPQFPTNMWDNDQVHIDVHSSYMKTEEFELLDDMNKQVIVAHWQEHVQKVLSASAQQPQPNQPAPQGAPQ